ncbi:hypothetical protein [Planctomycetes bacterium K23_9]|uniref:Cna protein B-type domain protein n=1 Tax=Stieleria marina TaxID=1930275 RepID=A0A517NTG0_9BACT|nr:hypothetical protein K239x_23660 [Planctomycetes bacterium K23_9]
MTLRRIQRAVCLVAFTLGSSSLLSPTAIAQELGIVDNESATRRIPADNVALFDANHAVVSVQLKSISDSMDDTLAGTSVTVIDPEKSIQTLTADESGVVEIHDVQEGVYAVVATNGVAHGAMMVACRKVEVADPDGKGDADPFDLDFEREPQIEPINLMMMRVGQDSLRPIIANNFLLEQELSLRIVDQALVRNSLSSAAFESTIQLGEDGALRGRLISVINPTSRYSGVAGTLIVIFKDGIPIGKTTANALGQFQINSLKPGTHGLVVAGRGGYAAFGFNAVEGKNLLARSDGSRSFAYSQLMNDGEVLPVALLPPPMMAAIQTSVETIYDAQTELQENTQQMLAQDNGPSQKDLATLESLRNSMATNNVEAKTPIKEAPAQVMQPLAPPVAAAPDKLSHRQKKVPVNPLRLTNRNSNAPYNPLRAE